MAVNTVAFVPNLTFVSITGPTLDNASAKTMRAHTTRANFARRRLRLVQAHASHKSRTGCVETAQFEEDDPTTAHYQGDQIQIPILSNLGWDRKLDGKDTFFINHLTQAVGKLHLTTTIPPSDTALAVRQSEWGRFLPESPMLDVSLYFARHVYAARLQNHAFRFVLDAYKGKAIRSVREHLKDESTGLSDGLIAAVLLLTVLDQVLGDIESWKIHISGLLQIIAVRSRNPKTPPPPWVPHAIPRTTLQGLLLFTRHDVELLTTIEKTRFFDSMLSAPAKRSAHLLLANAEQVAAWQRSYVQNQKLLNSEQLYLRRILKSLDTAIQLNSTARTEEAFLTAIALSIKIFLEFMLRSPTDAQEEFENTAARLMEVLQKPEQQLCSSLELCSSLQFVFWQTTMGAIAAPDAATKSFYISRLDRITIALALTSWHDASIILQRFFWIPSVFSGPCYQALSEIVYSQGHTNM